MEMEKHTILYIDDDLDDLELLREAFHKIDPSYQITLAEGGKKGLKILREMKSRNTLPCLIVLDLNMPGLNGWETFKAIKEDPGFDPIPIVIFSTSNHALDKAYFEIKGLAYLVKPIDVNTLLNTASQLLHFCKN